MTLRYWLTLLCVVLPFGVPCDAYNSRLHDHQEQATGGGVWAELGWPALPDFRRPVYTRAYHRLNFGHYPQRSLSAASETSPNAKPVPASSQHRTQENQHHATSSWTGRSVRPNQSSYTVHKPQQASHTGHRPHHTSHTGHRPHHTSHTVQRQHQRSHTNNRVALRPSSTTRGEVRPLALPVHNHNTGRRSGQQWLFPRRFLISTDLGRGRGTVQTCQDGKIWQNNKCECPYLSNWNEDTNKCECVYGTYRHSSGTCRSY